jgi:diguanylate cyclase (GGDEF)-like protein/PAS domain S-box-containing protein
MTTDLRRPPIKSLRLAGSLAAILLGISAGLILIVRGQQLRETIFDVIAPVLDLLACAAIILAVRHISARSKRLTAAWGTIALALLLNAAGDITWAVLELGLKVQPYPSIADYFYLAYIPCLLIGVILLPKKTITAGKRINRAIDLGLFLIAGILIYWNFLLGPISSGNAGQPGFVQVINMAYPVGDLVLLGALIVLLFNRSMIVDETPLLFLSGSLLIVIITDSIFSIQSLEGTYTSGGWLDLGWIVGSLLQFLAGAALLAPVKADSQRISSPKSAFLDRLNTFRPFLIYLWLAGAFALLITRDLSPLPMSILSISLGVGAIIALVIVRQMITLSENRRLNTQFLAAMGGLQTQAGELEKKNLELQKEISERKQAEAQREGSVSLLRATLDSTTDGILVVDPSGKITSYNRRFTEMWGIPESVLATRDDDQALAFVLEQLVRPEDFIGKVRELYTNQAEESFDVLEFKDGRIFERYSQPERINETIVGRVWSFRDTTTRMQAEKERQTLLEIMQGVLNTEDLHEYLRLIHLAIAKVIFAENFFVTLRNMNTGLFEEVYSVDKYDPPAQPSTLENSICAYVLRSGEPLLLTQEFFDGLKARGEVDLVGTNSRSWLGVPLITSIGIIGVMVVQDYETDNRYSEHDKEFLFSIAGQVAQMVERKRVEDALQASESEHRALFAAMPDEILILDNEGRYIRVSTSNPNLLIRPPEELIGKTLHEIFPREEADIYFRHIQTALETGQAVQFEYTFPIQNKMVWFSANISPMSKSSVIWVARDITERKQAQALQEAVYQIATATEATRSLDDLYPKIHEIIASVMPAENFYIGLYDEAEDILRFPYFKDVEDEPFVGGVHPGRGLTAYVLRTGKSLLCDMQLHYELERQGEIKLLGVPSAIWLGVPLIIEGKTIGAMAVQHYTDLNAYGEREQKIMEFVSSQIAIAITRKQSEKALEAERNLLRTLVDNIPDIIYVKDTESRFVLGNINVAQLMGAATPEELIGKTDHDFYPEELAAQFLADEQEVIRSGQTMLNKEELIIRSDNSQGQLLTIKTPLRDENGKVVGVVGIGRDITERKKAEQALENSEAELRALFTAMTDVVIVYDREGRYLKIAPTDPGLLIKPPDQLIGKSMYDVFPKAEAGRLIHCIQSVLDSGIKMDTEYYFQIGGQIRWFAATISPMQADSAIWVAHDITESKRAGKVQEIIYGISQAAISSDSIDELYQSIHTILAELINVENFYIALYDPTNDLISFPYYKDLHDEPPPDARPGRGLTEYIMRIGKPLLIPLEKFNELVQKGEVETVGTPSVDWLGVPLKVEGQVIGVMATQSYQETVHFKQEDLRLFEFVSTQVALMIDRKRVEEKIKYLGIHDMLTGIYNRAYFEEEMSRIERGRRFPVSILMADVDRLKVINDNQGHEAGDMLLKNVAMFLAESFRAEDVVARLGGDEFSVLMPSTNTEEAERALGRLRQILLDHNANHPDETPICISIGVSTAEKGVLLSDLLKEADLKMYEEKREHNIPSRDKIRDTL